MVTISKPTNYAPSHALKSKIHFDGFAEGQVKRCLIQKMSCGRIAVMATSYNDYFYKVLSGLDELNESFDEVE